jgi:hypothetical protein
MGTTLSGSAPVTNCAQADMIGRLRSVMLVLRYAVVTAEPSPPLISILLISACAAWRMLALPALEHQLH